MSSEAKRLTRERKITVETYSETKNHTIRVYKKSTDKNYVILVKMIDLQKRLYHQNLCHLATKKIKVSAVQNTLLNSKSKNTKAKQINGIVIMLKVSTFVKILLIK